MENVAEALAGARDRNGYSVRQVRDALLPLMGRYTPTEQTVSQYHKPDRFPAKPDLTLLFALARVYHDPEVSAAVAAATDDVAELLRTSLQEVWVGDLVAA